VGALIAGVNDLVGWTPIAVDLDDAEPWVEWTCFGDRPFDEPFFADTIAKHLEGPTARRVRTSPVALERVAVLGDAVGPSALVFHGSRCGSTALANALAAVGDAVVVREPVVLGRALLHEGLPPERLLGLLRCLAVRRSATQRRTFLKTSSFHVLFADRLCDALPGVPRVFLYRDPLEVAVSLLERPPRWAAMFRAGRFGLAERDAGPEALVAHAVGSFYRAALACPRLELVEYRQLADGGCVALVERLAGAALCSEERNGVARALARDAKDRSAGFRPDAAQKQARASDRLRAAVDRLARPHYDALEERRTSAA
jgi:hypothetical protein